MPESLFFQLEEEKRARIIKAGIEEFGRQSYQEASTNHLVKVAGISKGSLFKYFASKEDLYFYLLDQVINDLIAGVSGEIESLQGDLFSVILRFAEVEFRWHFHNPDSYQLMKKAFSDQASVMYPKILERYNVTGDTMYEQILKGVDTKGLRWDKNKTMKIIKWVLEGFNEEFMKRYQHMEDVTVIKKDYMKELTEYLDMIRVGVDQEGQNSNLGGDGHV